MIQIPGWPSHGRGRRFNPYSAHHFSITSRQYPAVAGRTIRKPAYKVGGKSVGFVHRPFAHLTSEVAMDEERGRRHRRQTNSAEFLWVCRGIKPPLLPERPLADPDADPQLQPRPLNRPRPQRGNANDHASNSYSSARHRPRHKRHATADQCAAKWDRVHLALHHAGAAPDLAA